MLVLSVSAQEKKAKTGWNFGGALPAVTYDSDLGLEYGALATFSIMVIRVYIPIISIILIQKFQDIQKEAEYTGSCLNHVILFLM